MAKAIRIHEHGSPAVLCWEEVEVAPPAADEVQIRQEAIGLNFIDTYHRSGLYPVKLPSTLGLEAAGVVQAVGSNVAEFMRGDRVAYAGGSLGAYTEVRNYPAARLIKLPEQISTRRAAAMMLQGLTAQYLLRRTYQVKPGDTILIHAAAGGVGVIACQWAKALGATVIGTVGSVAKAALAHSRGCDHVIQYGKEDFVSRVREITGGKGVPVVYDGVGKDTFVGSLNCLAPLGMMVSFGNASGPPPLADLLDLSRLGSLFITRPTLAHYSASRADLLGMADELFDIVSSGKVKIEIGQVYPLKDAATAHTDLSNRKTTGATVLLP